MAAQGCASRPEPRRGVGDRDRQREAFYLTELYRLGGDSRATTTSGLARAVWRTADFATALEIADRYGARQLFLRAAISRARLWCSLDRQTDARALLDRARDGLTEGPGLPDALDAAALAF